MKMKKTLILATALLLLLSSCSKPGEGGEEASGNTTAEDTTVTAQQTVEPTLEATVTENGLRYELTAESTYALVAYEGSEASVTVPAKVKDVAVTEIADRVFADNTKLTSVKLSDGITTLGNEVFSGCSALTTIEIPKSVAAIGYSSFVGTPWLAAQSGTEYVICGNGVLIAYNGKAMTAVIPEDLNILYISDAFRGMSNLMRIEVAETVRVIGDYAFADCVFMTYLKLPQELDWISNSSVEGCLSLKTIEN